MRAAPMIDSRMARDVYRADGSGDSLATRLSNVVVPLNVNRNALADALVLNVAGDWLFVDPSGTGYALARLDDTTDSGNEVALFAGRVIRTPFRRLTLRHGRWPDLTALALSNAGTVPRMRIFYGQGPCPFDDHAGTTRNVYAATVATTAGNAAGVSGTFDAPAGAVLDITVRGQQTCTAAGSAILVPRLDLNVGATVLSGDIAPDSIDRITGNAAGAISYLSATWRNVYVPLRDSATDLPTLTGTATLSVLDVGTEAVNSVFFDEITVLVR